MVASARRHWTGRRIWERTGRYWRLGIRHRPRWDRIRPRWDRRRRLRAPLRVRRRVLYFIRIGCRDFPRQWPRSWILIWARLWFGCRSGDVGARHIWMGYIRRRVFRVWHGGASLVRLQGKTATFGLMFRKTERCDQNHECYADASRHLRASFIGASIPMGCWASLTQVYGGQRRVR